MNFRTALARLRLIGLVEGTSCVLLFFGAMPLKYLAGQSWVVTVVGSIHGGLFIMYCLAVVNAWKSQKWSVGRAVLAGLVSIPPFATFVFDRSLKREQEATEPQFVGTGVAS